MKPTNDGMPFSDILPPTPIINSRPVTILFLAANPMATAPLRLDEEVRSIEMALHRAEFRGHFRLEQHWAVRITEIQGLLLQYRPDIVHFSGHGNTNQELIFLDDVGNPQSVAPEAFSRLFGLLKDNIRCVLLNACYSFVQAQAIAQHIDAVVGVSQAIGDQASIQFASAFYQAIGFGRSVKSAFDLGRSQIELTNLDGAQAPQLIALRSDPAQIGFVNYSHPLPSSINDGHALRNRAAMLKLLADFWIDGVLKQSLYQEVLLDLGMQIREEVVHPHLWDMEVRPLRGTARRLLPSARIGSVFEEMHRSLLILGEPGHS